MTNEAAQADKWEVQVRKGCLELAILAALWREKRYGLEILQTLAKQCELTVPEGTIYPLLARLKAEGLVSAEWVEAEAGHPRKYYRLTASGRRRAAQMAKFWAEFTENLKGLLEPLRREER